VDPDTLVRTVTDRTPHRDQDRAVSAEAVDQLFDQLASPAGLTEHASTFTRPDVLVALGAGLAGAGRTELEALADRFLTERAVSVVADRTLEERRWSTPDLLAVEQRLVTAATDRTEEQTAVASHQVVREALAAHPTASADQQAMVRDLPFQDDAGFPAGIRLRIWWSIVTGRRRGRPQSHIALLPPIHTPAWA
jgi:hypothetical protein